MACMEWELCKAASHIWAFFLLSQSQHVYCIGEGMNGTGMGQHYTTHTHPAFFLFPFLSSHHGILPQHYVFFLHHSPGSAVWTGLE